MATPQELQRAQRELARRQQQLEQLDKVRAQMVAAVEAQAKQLAQLQAVAESNIQNLSGGTVPNLSQSGIANFRDQYSQFNTTTAQKLSGPETPTSILPSTRKALQATPNAPGAPSLAPPVMSSSTMGREALPAPREPESNFNMADSRVNWRTLTGRSPEKTYISGTYVRTINGHPIQGSGKQYEYELTAGALPMSVGEEIVAPVHPGGHYRGMLGKKTNLIYRVDSIYEGRKYFGEHDRIEEKVSG